MQLAIRVLQEERSGNLACTASSTLQITIEYKNSYGQTDIYGQSEHGSFQGLKRRTVSISCTVFPTFFIGSKRRSIMISARLIY